MPASSNKVGTPISVWQSLGNTFINQASNLKMYWDQVGEIVRAKHDDLCDYIDSYIATKEELSQVVVGIIPDQTIGTAKIVDDAVTYDKLADNIITDIQAKASQYVRNRIPTSSDNFASGHRIGDAWYIPDITLNNLIPTPTAINTADFTIQNANASVSGSAVTLACLGGFDYASFKRAITPVAGALYVLFADLKLTSTHVLTSLSLNDQTIANPVKDTVYHVACIVTAPTQMEIKAQALTAGALNGATVVIDKLTIVNMTADMDGVPFDKAGAEAYFPLNPVFLTHAFNNAKTRWYCSDNGVWQSSSQLSDATSELYGVGTVDEALKRAFVDYSSYQAFCSNVNVTSLDCAFGKNNENRLASLGLQLAMYSWFKGKSKTTYPYTKLIQKQTLDDCISDPESLAEIFIMDDDIVTELIISSPYALSKISQISDGLLASTICNIVGLNPSLYPTMASIVASTTAMQLVFASNAARYAIEITTVGANAMNTAGTYATGDITTQNPTETVLRNSPVWVYSIRNHTSGSYTASATSLYNGGAATTSSVANTTLVVNKFALKAAGWNGTNGAVGLLAYRYWF